MSHTWLLRAINNLVRVLQSTIPNFFLAIVALLNNHTHRCFVYACEYIYTMYMYISMTKTKLQEIDTYLTKFCHKIDLITI